MAITKLPVNFQDDIIDTSINENRKYYITDNPDGTKSLEDATVYAQVGSYFGAEQIRQTNNTVNEVIDKIENVLDGTTAVGKSDSAKKLETPRKINGVSFDGTKDITVEDNTRLSLEDDFILANQEVLDFSNGTCTISNSKITAHSLADVYFTNDTYSLAEKAAITVETYDGRVDLMAGRPLEGQVRATIHIRVVE